MALATDILEAISGEECEFLYDERSPYESSSFDLPSPHSPDDLRGLQRARFSTHNLPFLDAEGDQYLRYTADISLESY
ncbi:uncharacterized protein PHALS_10340 [Plasmopara halstedii]|uniref:Uncharacterized protein n=1 Tax=Plasmopara halstedii TaxID=4781 RepID=A0A0N7L504_PLAHL|nr:uncharacterized protein PHALS_10340 [Plasmopara halstedii]CEG40123.1 hypothetical protein PHALS_10340 [Plasmopara halstedii]|eukprot:XP_024576492.1 hypothetical protein PHALS_10340 [Plasmopara halstedii]